MATRSSISSRPGSTRISDRVASFALGALVCAALASCTRNQPHIVTTYPATASYAGPSNDGQTEGALAVVATLQDCAADARLLIGPSCNLHGAWATADYGIDDDNRLWHRGLLLLDAGQTCTLALHAGQAVIRVSNGIAKLEDAHVIEVNIGGAIVSGPGAGGQATLSFSAPPAEKKPDAPCVDR